MHSKLIRTILRFIPVLQNRFIPPFWAIKIAIFTLRIYCRLRATSDFIELAMFCSSFLPTTFKLNSIDSNFCLVDHILQSLCFCSFCLLHRVINKHELLIDLMYLVAKMKIWGMYTATIKFLYSCSGYQVLPGFKQYLEIGQFF